MVALRKIDYQKNGNAPDNVPVGLDRFLLGSEAELRWMRERGAGAWY